jgi:hypothetical protein
LRKGRLRRRVPVSREKKQRMFYTMSDLPSTPL